MVLRGIYINISNTYSFSQPTNQYNDSKKYVLNPLDKSSIEKIDKQKMKSTFRKFMYVVHTKMSLTCLLYLVATIFKVMIQILCVSCIQNC